MWMVWLLRTRADLPPPPRPSTGDPSGGSVAQHRRRNVGKSPRGRAWSTRVTGASCSPSPPAHLRAPGRRGRARVAGPGHRLPPLPSPHALQSRISARKRTLGFKHIRLCLRDLRGSLCSSTSALRGHGLEAASGGFWKGDCEKCSVSLPSPLGCFSARMTNRSGF